MSALLWSVVVKNRLSLKGFSGPALFQPWGAGVWVEPPLLHDGVV